MKKPDLLIEQYYLKEKTPDGNEGERAEAIESIGRSNDEILAAYPAAYMENAVRAKLAENSGTEQTNKHRILRGTFTGWSIASTALAACLVIAVSAITITATVAKRTMPAGEGSTVLAMGDTRAKGSGPELFIYKKDGDNAVKLESNTKVLPNDIIQLSYIAGGAPYGAIISVDGNGVITQHYPDVGGITAMLLPRGETSLDYAYKLDDAPRFERFFFITGNTVFSTDMFKMKLAEAARSASSPDFAVPDVLKGKAYITDIILLK